MKSLSARLLVMTIGFVMLAEVLIFAPSVANFRQTWLNEKLGAAHLAILTLDAAPDGMVSEKMEMELLRHVGARSIAVKRIGAKIALINDMPPTVDATYDLRGTGPMMMIADAMGALFRDSERVIRVVGISPKDPEAEIDLIIDEAPLCEAITGFAHRIFLLSLAISVFTAGLVYLALHWLLVRPMRRITRNMVSFAENPEDGSRIIRPSRREDEVGTAQKQLADLQQVVQQALRQKQHLAALGTAVAKINHDLKGMLSSVLIVSDRLESSEDPEVRRIAPVLLSSIDRAVALCGQTMDYVGHDTPPVHLEPFALDGLVDELRDTLDGTEMRMENRLGSGFKVTADRDQMYRVISNLARNAVQAGACQVEVTGTVNGSATVIDVADNGPGLPPRAQEKLFRAFQGSARPGGTGLGLAIARELMRAQGGDLVLKETGAQGTVFRISLPPV